MLVEGRGEVGGEGLGEDGDGRVELVFGRKGCGDEDGGGGAAGGRAALEAGQVAEEGGGGEDFFDGDGFAEEGALVVGGVAAGLHGDLGKGGVGRAVAFLVLEAGAAEELDGHGRTLAGVGAGGGGGEVLEGRGAVVEGIVERAGEHLLETEGEGAVDDARGHGLTCEVERGGAGRAVVVDVEDRDAGHADFVERALAAGRVAVDVAHVGVLDRVVGEAGIGQREVRGAPGHGGVGFVGTGLDKGDHADAGDEDWIGHWGGSC